MNEQAKIVGWRVRLGPYDKNHSYRDFDTRSEAEDFAAFWRRTYGGIVRLVRLEDTD